MAGKDMPSLEVRANRGGRPPLSSRDRELGRDGSSGAILGKAPPVPNGGHFSFATGLGPGESAGWVARGSAVAGVGGTFFGICGRPAEQIKDALDHDGDSGI